MSRPLSAVLVDDEPLALRRLEFDLAKLADIDVVGTADTSQAGLDLITAKHPDIVFIDIKMPGLSGLDVIEALDLDPMPVVIFVTAYNRYAANAFELAAVDYLLKPVQLDRLRQAVERARRSLEQQEAAARIAELQTVIAALREEPSDEAEGAAADPDMWIMEGGAYVRVPAESIDWIKAERDYVKIFTQARTHLSRGKIGDIVDSLDPSKFMRVHRSAVVRLDAIARAVRAGGSLRLELKSGAEVPVARSYSRLFRHWIHSQIETE
jgi:DNA-binding LytR/AlgR family response regulator